MYLDPRVRTGISTFPLFADDGEIERGCERLSQDIRTGRFAEDAAKYQNSGGDYTFWIAEK